MAIDAERHRERRDRVRGLAASTLRADRLIVTHLPNVRYLTGFSGSNAVLVLGQDADTDLICTDGRYVDQVAHEAPGLPAHIDRDALAAAMTRFTGSTGTTAVEACLSIGDLPIVSAALGEPVVATGVVEQARAVKDADEIDALARACAITVEALEILVGEMRVGVTEVALARRLEQLFGDLGAEDRAFDTIVGSGPHAAIPHHQPGRRALGPGDLVVVDCGARVDGYHADMTRTFVVGQDPDPWQADLHRAVEEAQAAATAAYRDRTPAREIDTVARDLLTQAGLGERFTHGLGHGVGLEIHEAPMVGARSTGTLGADMVITVEPGAYLPGRGGVRIEDTLVVSDAAPRILTEAPRGLRVVG
jgi:Xaa-Pro aminopeptidase